MKKDFSKWIATFRESIANYTYYVDFETVYRNASEVKIELNMMNSLIGSSNIVSDFKNLVIKYPSVLKCIPILLAKREMDIFCVDEDGTFNFDFRKMNHSIDEYIMFMRKTGLFDLMQYRIIGNLFDYLLGVEVGLNSNGRKNRGGHLMEDLVESFIKKAGFIKDKSYFKEMYLSDLEKRSGIDLSTLSNSGNTAKRFDFVIISSKCIYACECNFYASGGSKLNETARSYKSLALESKGIEGFRFVWFTDGFGWNFAKNNLYETFEVLEDIYCINELEEGILNKF